MYSSFLTTVNKILIWNSLKQWKFTYFPNLHMYKICFIVKYDFIWVGHLPHSQLSPWIWRQIKESAEKQWARLCFRACDGPCLKRGFSTENSLTRPTHMCLLNMKILFLLFRGFNKKTVAFSTKNISYEFWLFYKFYEVSFFFSFSFLWVNWSCASNESQWR